MTLAKVQTISLNGLSGHLVEADRAERDRWQGWFAGLLGLAEGGV